VVKKIIFLKFTQRIDMGYVRKQFNKTQCTLVQNPRLQITSLRKISKVEIRILKLNIIMIIDLGTWWTAAVSKNKNGLYQF